MRALKMQGGVAKADLAKENHAAVKAGLANLGRHVANVRKFGVPVVVAINHFGGDNEGELDIIAKTCRDDFGAEAIVCKHWAEGGKGAVELAEKVVELAESGKANFQVLYPDELSLTEKMRKIAQEIYGAKDISIEPAAKKQIAEIEALGFGHLPVCVAKTQYSFSTDPDQARRADRSHRRRARSAALGRRRLRRDDHRRDHDHARPAESAGRGEHQARRQGTDRGAVLTSLVASSVSATKQSGNWLGLLRFARNRLRVLAATARPSANSPAPSTTP